MLQTLWKVLYRDYVSVFAFCFSYCTAELSPVCAIVGGVLGQEIIKVSWNNKYNCSPISSAVQCNGLGLCVELC